MEPMDSQKEEASVTWRRLSCTAGFDALGFCYYHLHEKAGHLQAWWWKGGEVWAAANDVQADGFHILSAPVRQTHLYYQLGVLDNYSRNGLQFSVA